jgi:hypothetical protein
MAGDARSNDGIHREQPKQRRELATPAMGGKRQPVPAIDSLFRTSFDLRLDDGCAGKLRLDWRAKGPTSQTPWSDPGIQTSHNYWGNWGQLEDHSVHPRTIIFA